MRINLSANLKHKTTNKFCREAQAAKFEALNLNSGRAMNAMKFIKIYAASVRDTMQQAGRDLAGREALTASLSRKILSAPPRFEAKF